MIDVLMIVQKLTKNPFLIVGLLCLFIFIMGLSKRGYFKNYRNKLMPTSCRAVRVKLDRRIPKNWATACEKNNLAVTINYIENINNKTKTMKDMRKYIYREVANDFILIAKKSPEDNLERTDIVRLRFNHPKMILNAVSEGKYVVKLATLKSKKLIIDHIKSTIQIQETLK